MDKVEIADRIMDDIRQVLLRDWDPIGVGDDPDAQDEYDGYIGGVYRVLTSGGGLSELVEHLFQIESDNMGFTPEKEALVPVAEKLLKLDVKLERT